MTRDPLLEGRSPAISLIWLVKTALLCETLLLNYWSLNITRHLAMIATGQTLVWWSSEIRPTPHKTNHKIWNQKKWKCHFCHCQLMYHKSLFKPPLLAAGKRKYCRKYWLIHKYHGNHNNLLFGFCGICNSGGRNITYMWIIVAKTAQIYEIHIMNYCICVKLLSFGK